MTPPSVLLPNQSVWLNENYRIKAYRKGRSIAVISYHLKHKTREPPALPTSRKSFQACWLFTFVRFASAMIMEHIACEHVEIGILFFLQKEATMPVILWLLGVPLVVVVVLMLTHVI